MPYDGTDFEPWPKPPKRSKAKERILCLVVFMFALVLLVAPISADTFIDIVHYLSRK
ncbi:MAG: hypothetical protein ACYDD1_01315 [Caulobacteraceae bacterium]